MSSGTIKVYKNADPYVNVKSLHRFALRSYVYFTDILVCFCQLVSYHFLLLGILISSSMLSSNQLTIILLLVEKSKKLNLKE